MQRFNSKEEDFLVINSLHDKNEDILLLISCMINKTYPAKCQHQVHLGYLQYGAFANVIYVCVVIPVVAAEFNP